MPDEETPSDQGRPSEKPEEKPRKPKPRVTTLTDTPERFAGRITEAVEPGKEKRKKKKSKG